MGDVQKTLQSLGGEAQGRWGPWQFSAGGQWSQRAAFRQTGRRKEGCSGKADTRAIGEANEDLEEAEWDRRTPTFLCFCTPFLLGVLWPSLGYCWLIISCGS